MTLPLYTIILIMISAALVGGYVITSFVLLRFPHLLHKRKSIKFRAVHISHRGGAGENLENTMTAFKHAYTLGTDMLELDCHITKDGCVVVSHDNNLKRTTGEEVEIAELNYQDLPCLKSQLKVDFDGDHFTQGCLEDRRIPLLREVFEEFPELPVNVDIKINNDELIRKVSDLIEEFDRKDITVWGNRSVEIENKLYKHNPSIALIFSMGSIMKLYFFYYTGLLPFVPLRQSFYEVIMPGIFLNSEKFPNLQTGKFRFLARLLDIIIMRPSIIKHLEKRGVQTNLWVLNEEQEFDRAFKLGVTGVMTDFPTKLSHYLDQNQAVKEKK